MSWHLSPVFPPCCLININNNINNKNRKRDFDSLKSFGLQAKQLRRLVEEYTKICRGVHYSLSRSTPKFAGGYTSSCYPVHYNLLGSTPSLAREYTIAVRGGSLDFAGVFACASFAAPSMLVGEYTILQLLVKTSN